MVGIFYGGFSKSEEPHSGLSVSKKSSKRRLWETNRAP